MWKLTQYIMYPIEIHKVFKNGPKNKKKYHHLLYCAIGTHIL